MLAAKTPMGWNSWNTFGSNISEQLIMEWRTPWLRRDIGRQAMSM